MAKKIWATFGLKNFNSTQILWKKISTIQFFREFTTVIITLLASRLSLKLNMQTNLEKWSKVSSCADQQLLFLNINKYTTSLYGADDGV